MAMLDTDIMLVSFRRAGGPSVHLACVDGLVLPRFYSSQDAAKAALRAECERLENAFGLSASDDEVSSADLL
jgi:hypothetical protein